MLRFDFRWWFYNCSSSKIFGGVMWTLEFFDNRNSSDGCTHHHAHDCRQSFPFWCLDSEIADFNYEHCHYSTLIKDIYV